MCIVQNAVQVARQSDTQSDTQPLSIVTLDARGTIMSGLSEDGISILRPDIAYGKAYAAIGMGLGTATIEGIAEERPYFASGLVAGQFWQIRARARGSAGISGDTSQPAYALNHLTAASVAVDNKTKQMQRKLITSGIDRFTSHVSSMHTVKYVPYATYTGTYAFSGWCIRATVLKSIASHA